MALDFLDDIYKKAMLIEYAKYTLETINSNRLSYAINNVWRERFLPLISQLSSSGDDTLPYESALQVSQNISDQSAFSANIDQVLLPSLYKFIEKYTTIDVSEEGYRIHSSASGFLTIFDSINRKYIHSPYDPMYEARIIARQFFDPKKSRYVIWGIGLAYLPYQLWTLSDESVSIKIFESDSTLIRFAQDYGVLDWIDNGSVEIIEKATNEIAKDFATEANIPDSCAIISPWLDNKILQYYKDFDRYMLNKNPCDKYRNTWLINNRKNRELDIIPFAKGSIVQKECNSWLVIAGGPSVDDNAEYIKSQRKNLTIIAVDAIARRLINIGIIPDVLVAIDSNDTVLRYLNGIEDRFSDIPLVTTYLTYWKYNKNFSGKKYSIQTRDSISFLGPQENDGPILDKAGISVSGVAIEIAYYCDAKEILLSGLDLGYPNGKMYAEEVSSPYIAEQEQLLELSVDGSQIPTTPSFLEAKKSIERQIKSHVNEAPVINLSRHGLEISGTDWYWK